MCVCDAHKLEFTMAKRHMSKTKKQKQTNTTTTTTEIHALAFHWMIPNYFVIIPKHLQKMFQYENVICAQFSYMNGMKRIDSLSERKIERLDSTHTRTHTNSLSLSRAHTISLNEKSIWMVNHILGQIKKKNTFILWSTNCNSLMDMTHHFDTNRAIEQTNQWKDHVDDNSIQSDDARDTHAFQKLEI